MMGDNNKCRQICEEDIHQNCLDCSHWSDANEKCETCIPGTLWDGSKCSEHCNGKGRFDPQHSRLRLRNTF